MKPKHYILLGVVLSIAVLLGINWNKWFGDLPEPDFQLSESPVRLFITAGEDGLHDRSFSWVSGSNSPFTFTLVKDSVETHYIPTHEEISTDGGTTHSYNVRLNDLAEGSYHCFITSESLQDTLRGNFSIHPNNEETNFILLGDIQDQYDSGSRELFQEIYSRFPDMDSWILIGDMVERPHDQWWRFFYHSIDSIASRTAFLPIPGNHEYELGGLSSLDKRFTSTFPMPLNGNRRTNYFIDYQTVRLIALETNNLFWHIRSSRKWLEQTIENSSAHFTIVMGHHGVISVRRGRNNLTTKHGINPILEKHKVDLLLQGHDHAYSRNGEVPSRPIYITMSTSAKHYPVGHPNNHTISESGQRYYSHIRVTNDTLYFKAYREDHSLLDSFELPKKL